MEAEIAQQNKIQASIHQETKFLKKSATELKDQIASLSNALQEFQAEERNLSKEIVQSPDRIKLDLANAMQTLEQVKKDIVRKQHERAMVRKQLEHTSAADEKLKQIMTDMNELEVKMQTYKLTVQELEDAQNTLRGIENDLEEKKKVKESQVKQLEAVGTLCFSFVASSAFHYVSHLTHIILIIIVYRKTKGRDYSRANQGPPVHSKRYRHCRSQTKKCRIATIGRYFSYRSKRTSRRGLAVESKIGEEEIRRE